MIVMAFVITGFFVGIYFGKYTVHIVPHSHMDVGWGWTIDQYYINRVINIYNTIHSELDSNNNRTFVICEISYFKRWYFNQTQETRSKFQRWSSEGRIEFVGGGIVMNDEALPSFQDIITNYEMGFEFIRNEFKTKPKVDWFLDSFGHSAANTHIMHKLGFENNILGRLDMKEKEHRITTKTVEFMWKPFNDEGIFTHILPYHYDISDNYTFAFQKYNFKDQSSKQKDWANIIAESIFPLLKAFNHNQFLLIFGHDFSYQKPNITYPILDLITSIQNFKYKKSDFEFIYSTPTNYFKKVQEQMNTSQLPIQTQFDCFPLRDRPSHYWSGYYTSRPYLKGSIKLLSNTYLVSSILLTELLLRHRKYISDNRDMLYIIGLMQHHDTITGTSNEWVSNDFIKIIHQKINETNQEMISILREQISNDMIKKICLNNPIVNYGCQDNFNLITRGNNSMVIGVINPLIDGDVLITFEFSNSTHEFNVYNEKNVLIDSDFYCVTNIEFKYQNKCFMSFITSFDSNIHIFSFTLKVNKKKMIQSLSPLPSKLNIINTNIGLINSLLFDPLTFSYSISLNREGVNTYNISLFHGIFPGNPNKTCEFDIKNYDGMYIFSSCTQKPIKVKANIETSYLFKGKISTVVIINFEKSYLIASIYYYPVFLKVDSLINPLIANQGTNFALVLESNILNNITLPSQKSEPEFWTDSNGIQMMRRIMQFRHMFPYSDPNTISGNFYPVTQSMSIREKQNKTYENNQYACLSSQDRMITIYNDRPQSGGVTKEGEMIILLSRNSIQDDDRGIGSNLYENPSAKVVFKVQHIIMLGMSIYDKDKNGLKSQKFMHHFFRNTPMLFDTSMKNTVKIQSFISQMIRTSQNIIMNFKIDSNKRSIIQFYCMYDYYFNPTNDYNIASNKYIGFISIVLPNNKFKIYFEALNGNEIKEKQNKLEYHRKLKPFDFLVLHLNLNY